MREAGESSKLANLLGYTPELMLLLSVIPGSHSPRHELIDYTPLHRQASHATTINCHTGVVSKDPYGYYLTVWCFKKTQDENGPAILQQPFTTCGNPNSVAKKEDKNAAVRNIGGSTGSTPGRDSKESVADCGPWVWGHLARVMHCDGTSDG
jgi:hypothetical protein